MIRQNLTPHLAFSHIALLYSVFAHASLDFSFEQIKGSYSDIFTKQFLSVLTNEFRDNADNISKEKILDQENNISSDILSLIVPDKWTKEEERPFIIKYIKTSCMPLDKFYVMTLQPVGSKNFKKDREHQIITSESFQFIDRQKSYIVNKNATAFNRLYYFTAFFGAIEYIFETTKQTEIDTYGALLKNIETHLYQYQFDFCQNLYEFFTKNHTVYEYSPTIGNIFLTVLLQRNTFAIPDYKFFAFFKKEELLIKSNNLSKAKHKLNQFFSLQCIQSIVRNSKIDNNQRLFLEELFDNNSFNQKLSIIYYFKDLTKLQMEDCLKNMKEIAASNNCPNYINDIIKNIILERTLKQLVEIYRIFNNDNTLMQAVHGQLAKLSEDYLAILKKIRTGPSAYKSIYDIEKKSLKHLDIALGILQQKSGKTNRSKTKKTTSIATEDPIEEPTIKIHKGKLITFIALAVGSGASWFYRAKIKQWFNNYIAQKRTVEIT